MSCPTCSVLAFWAIKFFEGKTSLQISIDRFPESLITPIAPMPAGVAKAQIVSFDRNASPKRN